MCHHQVKLAHCCTTRHNAAHARRSSAYRDILLQTPGGEHTIQLGTHALLGKQCKDDGVGQHHVRMPVDYLSVDTEEDASRLPAHRRDAVCQRAAVEQVAQPSAAIITPTHADTTHGVALWIAQTKVYK